MTQTLTHGEQLKLDGMLRATKKHKDDLERAQAIAKELSTGGRYVTSDDVRPAFSARYGYPLEIDNAIGSLFVGEGWTFVGRVKSTRKEAHSRYIGQWVREKSQ